MARMTRDELLQSIFTDSDADSDVEDYGPIVEGSDDEFVSMCEDCEDTDSENEDSYNGEVAPVPGHQQAKLVVVHTHSYKILLTNKHIHT